MFERVLLAQNAFEKFEFLSRFANDIALTKFTKIVNFALFNVINYNVNEIVLNLELNLYCQ